MSYDFPLRNKEFRDTLVRQKASTATADEAQWEWIDNNSFTITFGGTETDGNYVVTIDPVAANVASIPVTTVRAGAVPATNAALATQHVVDVNTLLAVDAVPPAGPASILRTYIQSASADAAVVTYIVQPEALAFTVTVSAPGAGTLAVNPDDTFPVTYDTLGYGPINGARHSIEFTVIPVDSSNIPLDPNGATTTLTARRMIDRGDRSRPYGSPSTPVGVSNTAAEANHPVGQRYIVKSNGGRYGIALGALTGTISGLDRLEVWAREITEG